MKEKKERKDLTPLKKEDTRLVHSHVNRLT